MTSSPLTLPLLSVNVGRPVGLAGLRGEPVLSGIRKSPVAAERLLLTETNLAGDGQADLTVHGGPDKAVYAYSARHWPAWKAEHGLAAAPGTFGENLTFDGADEDEIRIGDVFAWGKARLQVSQPRRPCFKLALHLGRTDIAPALVLSGRSGFYLRVLRPAHVPLTQASLVRLETNLGAPNVRETFHALYDPHQDAAALRAFAATPALAADWRGCFLKRAAAHEPAEQ